MKRKSVSYKILRLFTITMFGTCAFAIAEGNYQQEQQASPHYKQDKQQSSAGQRSQNQESYQREPDGPDRSMSQTARDAWIQGKLEATLAYNQDLSSFAIDSEVKNGVVYLKGNVETQTAKDLASQLARSIEGVNKVENNLRVIPDNEQG